MPRSKQKNALVIDQSSLGQSKLLAQVFEEHHAPFGVIQIENPINAVSVFREDPAVVFVVLNDLELSIMPNGKRSFRVSRRWAICITNSPLNRVSFMTTSLKPELSLPQE
jgi:hypothetical protein